LTDNSAPDLVSLVCLNDEEGEFDYYDLSEMHYFSRLLSPLRHTPLEDGDVFLDLGYIYLPIMRSEAGICC
jgi:hypothetical protein